MRVIVTGGTGYIGRILVPDILKRGYEVTVIDRGFLDYSDPIKDYGDQVALIRDDIRTCDPEIFNGADAVVDLAALSNDPAGNLNKMATWDINYVGRVRIARLAKKLGVNRYVVASSCSVYGFRQDICTEATPVNPLTTYAEANIAIEKDNLSLNDSNFRSTALRFATVFGYSERFRLDLVINAMAFYGFKNHVIKMMRDGKQFRPFIHVKDVSRAIISAIESEKDEIGGRFINIGSNSQNVQISDVAEMIRKEIGDDCRIELYGDPDNRSYKVSFDLAKELLGFQTKYDIHYGIKEIIDKCEDGIEDVPQMHTVDYYKRLLESEKNIGKFISLKSRILF